MGKKQDYPALPARVSGTRKKSSGTVCRSWEFPITTHHTPPASSTIRHAYLVVSRSLGSGRRRKRNKYTAELAL